MRLVLLTAMAAMFVIALAIPEAFDDLDGGLPGPVVVAVCYFVFRLMHLVMFWLLSEGDAGLRRQLLRFAPSMVGATAVLLVASGTDGTTQTLLWILALTVDYLGTLLGGASGWRIVSPGHVAERHGLIPIVAGRVDRGHRGGRGGAPGQLADRGGVRPRSRRGLVPVVGLPRPQLEHAEHALVAEPERLGPASPATPTASCTCRCSSAWSSPH